MGEGQGIARSHGPPGEMPSNVPHPKENANRESRAFSRRNGLMKHILSPAVQMDRDLFPVDASIREGLSSLLDKARGIHVTPMAGR